MAFSSSTFHCTFSTRSSPLSPPLPTPLRGLVSPPLPSPLRGLVGSATRRPVSTAPRRPGAVGLPRGHVSRPPAARSTPGFGCSRNWFHKKIRRTAWIAAAEDLAAFADCLFLDLAPTKTACGPDVPNFPLELYFSATIRINACGCFLRLEPTDRVDRSTCRTTSNSRDPVVLLSRSRPTFVRSLAFS
uniref:(northern house mosquito) hypothetical protein n=1 Tax=Culex pipiens TaxID=7175 RepID=A0A8D8N738_CULPI